MGIEHFQKFDVRSDHRDQIPLIPALQLRRAELPQSREHLVPDDGQQFKCDKVVAVLLSIVEDPPHHCHHDQYKKQGAGPHPKKQPGAGRFYTKTHGFHSRVKERMHQSVPGKDRQEDSAQIPYSAKHDGKEHDRQKEPYQPDQLSHDPDAAAPA